MSATVVKNSFTGDEPILAPLKEDGNGYRYCMYFNGDADAAFADTYLELIEMLLPGYSSLEEEDQDVARIQFAQTAAASVQAMILAELEEDQVTPEEYEILSVSRQLPQPEVRFWKTDVPLVVVETSYTPYTEVPPPSSALGSTRDVPNIWWIRPTEEEDFLISLHEVGIIRLMENIEPISE